MTQAELLKEVTRTIVERFHLFQVCFGPSRLHAPVS